jgi:hypothetical protein
MVRSHSLIVWSVVFGLLMAADLCAADRPNTKSPGSDNPFASDAKPAKPATQDRAAPKEKPATTVAKAPHHAAAEQMHLRNNVAAIEDALASPTELDFSEAPLQDVIDYLKSKCNIEIQLDRRVLEDVSVTTDTPVTINVKGIRLESALRLMLRNMQPELTYMIKNEVLLITTPDIAAEELATKLYSVGDLVGCRDEHDAPWDDYDALIDVITSTIKPTTWDTAGAPGSATGNTFGTAKVLVVTQTHEVHEEIAGLLAKIREIAKSNPNAGTPRRNRPAPRPPRGNTPAPTAGAGSGVGGTSASSIAPKPAEKPADSGKPPEKKPSAPVPGGVKPS